MLGHRNIPMNSVGCYVPGGKYPLVASAHMGVVTAKVAGVKRIVAMRRRYQRQALAPPWSRRWHLAGADEIYVLGGVQAVAAMALGTETIRPVDMLVGPGNAYVAEAKRQLFGRVGIDLLRRADRDAGDRRRHRRRARSARPTCSARPSTDRARPPSCSPIREKLAARHSAEIERLLGDPADRRDRRPRPGRDYGQVIVCDSEEEMVAEADRIASEHVQVMTRDPDVFPRTA